MTVVAASTCQLFWLRTYWGEAEGVCLLGVVLRLTPAPVSSSGDMFRNSGFLA